MAAATSYNTINCSDETGPSASNAWLSHEGRERKPDAVSATTESFRAKTLPSGIVSHTFIAHERTKSGHQCSFNAGRLYKSPKTWEKWLGDNVKGKKGNVSVERFKRENRLNGTKGGYSEANQKRGCLLTVLCCHVTFAVAEHKRHTILSVPHNRP